jgi:hypothetical protein
MSCPHVEASSLKMQASHPCETLASLSVNKATLHLLSEDCNFIYSYVLLDEIRIDNDKRAQRETSGLKRYVYMIRN